MNSFIQEVMRMYPPLVRIDRYASSNVTIPLNGKNVEFKVGDRVRLPIYHMHYNEELFKNATVFDPDRFMPGGVSRDQRIYTFAIASRNCIGESFARLVMRLSLTHLIKHYSVEDRRHGR